MGGIGLIVGLVLVFGAAHIQSTDTTATATFFALK